jgi:hypothetical protein
MCLIAPVVWRSPGRLRRRHVDGKRVEGTPKEEVQGIRRRGRTLLSGRPARVAEGHRPDGARAGALEMLDGRRGRALRLDGLKRPKVYIETSILHI